MAIDHDALKKLLDIVGGDPEDLAEFIEDFIEIAPNLVAEMRDGSSAADWEKVRIAAHTLKSNAKDLGAPDLSELSKALEDQCKTGNTAESVVLIDQIAAQTTAATAGLSEIDPATL
ncbi:Hpt domain-containing protein [Tateyamaria sp. SN3-11]|uniref:Hpt domain-containing protein n=1 Tax=Tateyamaria sp. SN3-11 TaxID=3092147 RepID=UPI0039E9DE97